MLWQTFAPSKFQVGKVCGGDHFGLLWSGQQDGNVSSRVMKQCFRIVFTLPTIPSIALTKG